MTLFIGIVTESKSSSQIRALSLTPGVKPAGERVVMFSQGARGTIIPTGSLVLCEASEWLPRGARILKIIEGNPFIGILNRHSISAYYQYSLDASRSIQFDLPINDVNGISNDSFEEEQEDKEEQVVSFSASWNKEHSTAEAINITPIGQDRRIGIVDEFDSKRRRVRIIDEQTSWTFVLQLFNDRLNDLGYLKRFKEGEHRSLEEGGKISYLLHGRGTPFEIQNIEVNLRYTKIGGARIKMHKKINLARNFLITGSDSEVDLIEEELSPGYVKDVAEYEYAGRLEEYQAIAAKTLAKINKLRETKKLFGVSALADYSRLIKDEF